MQVEYSLTPPVGVMSTPMSVSRALPGEIQGTIHTRVVDEYMEQLSAGAVLVLRQVVLTASLLLILPPGLHLQSDSEASLPQHNS